MTPSDLTIDMSTAGASYTRWIDARNLRNGSLQVDCGAVASPVGVVTVEASNDRQCDYDIRTDVAGASTTAKLVDITAALTVRGTAFATGFDGSGAKASWCELPANLPSFFRIKYTRASGGSGDTLHVRVQGRPNV